MEANPFLLSFSLPPMSLYVLYCTVLADLNFPSALVCRQGPELIGADGKSVTNAMKNNLNLLTFILKSSFMKDRHGSISILMDVEPSPQHWAG